MKKKTKDETKRLAVGVVLIIIGFFMVLGENFWAPLEIVGLTLIVTGAFLAGTFYTLP